jgi:8-amino-7-oxononanoate synthase
MTPSSGYALPRQVAEVAELLGVEDALAFPTLTHIHSGVLPVLVGEGTLLVDGRAHQTIHDAAVLARARGASVRRFRPGDVGHAERLLRGPARPPVVLCMDGVNSMTGNPPDLAAFADLARRHDALLYVDDAHGFAVIGERTGYDPTPHLKATVSYVYGGSVTVASLATALLGLEVNRRRGDELRERLFSLTRALLERLDKLGVATTNTCGFPLVELAVADAADLDAVGRHLFDRGVYVTLAPYPVVPRREVGFRVQVTAANTTEQLELLLTVLEEVDDRFGFRRPHPA